MASIQSIEELQHAVKGHFNRLAPCGIKATVAEIMEFIKKETGSPDEKWVQNATVTVINDFARDAFLKVPAPERAVFLPHCLRSIQACRAPVDSEGYKCVKCGACKISPLVEACERRGMKWYVVGGGSQLVNIIRKHRPRAVIGVACFNEVRMGIDQLAEMCIPAQAVVLSRAGCVNTDVVIDEVLAKIEM